jgi:myo-inositol-1(or 4)-monophosphatase
MMPSEDVARIREALRAAAEVVRPFSPGAVEYEEKAGRAGPVTEADRAADDLLRRLLPRKGEGWLSEETADSPERLGARRVWVVDPLDGTREFVEGIPEWCISIGLVDDGIPVAGGILNPATREEVVGSLETGVTLNGEAVGLSGRERLEGALILGSRSEWKRGEWNRFQDAPFHVKPCGSVAYKLAMVAAGLADGTWTLVPKHEWDVAAGAALVMASGGKVLHADGSQPRFNRPNPLLPNLLAAGGALLSEFRTLWLP